MADPDRSEKEETNNRKRIFHDRGGGNEANVVRRQHLSNPQFAYRWTVYSQDSIVAVPLAVKTQSLIKLEIVIRGNPALTRQRGLSS